MLARCVIAGLSLLLSVTWRQVAAPTTSSSRPADVDELVGQINEMVRVLPKIDAAITAQQQQTGLEACRLFRSAWEQRDQMGGLIRLRLGVLGMHGGFAAGDAEVMLSGAKLLMQETRKTKLESYANYAMVWAAIFGADSAAATGALNQLIAHPPQKHIAEWARGLLPIAKQCSQPLLLKLSFLDGQTKPLADFRGQAVVLDFWASWCDPCIKAVPEMKKFYQERAKDDNFVMIGISLDESAADAKAAIAKYGLTWPQAVSPKTRRRFLGRGIPHIVVISPTGCILWQGHPVAEGTLTMVTDFARRQAEYLKSAPPAQTHSAPATAPPVVESKPPSVSPAEARADQKLKVAMAYRKAGLINKAKALLREVVQEHPHTAAAAKAREELSRLP